MHLSVAACPEGRRSDLLDLVAASLFTTSREFAHCEAETYRLYPDKNATERPSGRATGPVGGRAEPFFVTAHYNGHPLVLVRPEKLDLEWAKANLIRVWRAQAPKGVLKA